MREELESRLLRGYQLWNRRDFDGLMEFFQPDVEIDATSRVLNPSRYRGLAGLRQLTEETFDVWEEWSIEPTRFLWNGGRVLVETAINARGKGSGIHLTETYHTVIEFEDGKVSVMEIHVDAAGAFESIGLSRETA